MTDRLVVSVIKVVQIRTEYLDPRDGKVRGYNKKFQKPTVAADHWALNKFIEWERKTNFQYRNSPQYYTIRNARIDKLYRRALPIFRAILAG